MNQVLLELLKEKQALSGEEIGLRLGISRAAVWKQINRIKERNISVESVHGKGYRINHLPGKGIIPELLFNAIQPIDLEIFHYPSLGSTNTRAKELALNIPHHFLVICDEQTAGRGRRGRSWLSNQGLDLTFTLGLYIEDEIMNFFRYTIITALSVYEVLSEYSPHFAIKWPNDILWKDKKICGILSEMITEAKDIRNVLIGVGININSEAALETAQTLQEITGQSHDLNLLLSEFIKKIFSYLPLIHQGRFPEILELWKQNLAWMGQEVVLTEGDHVMTGTLIDASEDGSLLLQDKSGIRHIHSGDLNRSLRPIP